MCCVVFHRWPRRGRSIFREKKHYGKRLERHRRLPFYLPWPTDHKACCELGWEGEPDWQFWELNHPPPFAERYPFFRLGKSGDLDPCAMLLPCILFVVVPTTQMYISVTYIRFVIFGCWRHHFRWTFGPWNEVYYLFILCSGVFAFINGYCIQRDV